MGSASVFRKRTGDIISPYLLTPIPETGWKNMWFPPQPGRFSGAGAGISIQELERRIAAEWLPASGYEFADAPDIEVYFEPDPQDTRYEVWVPVRRA